MCGVSLKLEKANKSHHQKNKSVSYLFVGLRYIWPLEKPEFKKYLQVNYRPWKIIFFLLYSSFNETFKCNEKKKAMKSTLF